MSTFAYARPKVFKDLLDVVDQLDCHPETKDAARDFCQGLLRVGLISAVDKAFGIVQKPADAAEVVFIGFHDVGSPTVVVTKSPPVGRDGLRLEARIGSRVKLDPVPIEKPTSGFRPHQPPPATYNEWSQEPREDTDLIPLSTSA